MRIIEINTTSYGSTGKIMFQIASIARNKNHEVYTCSMKWRNQVPLGKNHIYYGSFFENAMHRLLGQLTGTNGQHSIIGTYRFLKEIEKINPDIIHLHNLHDFCINLAMLFEYIKKHDIPVVWTLHDCWAFTGQCPHFTLIKCDKWKHGCYQCPQYREYPASYIDRTKTMWKLKKKWFTGLKNMTIVTPSQWLAGLVKQSYLKDYPLKIINNGIDLSVFKPTSSDFRERFGLNKKYIVLGVAFGWGKRKGLDVFIDLANKLDKSYQIVLVGTDDEIDKLLPDNILSIHRTHNQTELAEIYSAADVFVNPTREEVLGLVNIESLACGTPVITFNTGGSPECIDENTGSVIDCDDIDAMQREIIRICENKPFSSESCLKRAEKFDMSEKFKEYVRLYENITHST